MAKKLKFIINEFKENQLYFQHYEDHFIVQGTDKELVKIGEMLVQDFIKKV